MSTTATRSYTVGTLKTFQQKRLSLYRAELATEAIATYGDDRYFAITGGHGALSPNPDLSLIPQLDAVIPTGATIDSVTLNIRLAASATTAQLVHGFTYPATNNFYTTCLSPVVNNEVKDDQWIDASYEFVGPTTLSDITQYYYGISNGSQAESVYVDYADFDVTFTLAPGNPSAAAVFETTPYSAKVRASVSTGQCSNSTYPMTAWFEWASVDPTGIDDLTDFPLETTTVQTFTADPVLWEAGRPGTFLFYDTLPSPLDVQKPRNRLQPNTTYWVRAATAVNGETLYSADWTSFTTSRSDAVTL